MAPHLNPPMQNMYNYARQHILWNKPDLFFEDWEVRYGLWKRFRGRQDTDDLKSTNVKTNFLKFDKEDKRDTKILTD